MSPETPRPSKGLMEFILMKPEQGINQFILEGQKLNATKIDTIIGLYGQTNAEVLGIEYYMEHVSLIQKNSILSHILHIEIPEYLKGYQNNYFIKKYFKTYCTSEHRPFAALLFGLEIKPPPILLTTNPSVELLAVRGMRPSEALQHFQTVARMELAVNN